MLETYHRTPYRDAATLFLGVVLAFAVVSVVLDGGRPAVAANDCQYGPYGQYGQPCPRAKPTLRLSVPGTTEVGTHPLPIAVLENGDNPTGQLVVRLHRPDGPCADPTQAPPWTGQVTVTGNGHYIASSSDGKPPTLDRIGPWTWSATYVGDGRNEPASTVCGAFVTEVVRRTTSLSLTVAPQPVTVGRAVSAQTSITGLEPTGSLAVRLFAPDDPSCRTAVSVRTLDVGGSGSLTVRFVPTSPGTWRVTGEYSGDDDNAPTAMACDASAFGVVKARPSLSVSAVPRVAVARVRLHARARLRLAYQPTGRVSFALFPPGDPSCAGPPAHLEDVVLSRAGAMTSVGFKVPALSAGTWNWTATYHGDANNESRGTACGSAPVKVVR